MRLGPPEQDRIAIWRRTGDGGGTKRRATATDVLYDHRPEENFHLIPQWPTDRIERATWWKMGSRAE